jgi:ketosteroid isomerase-like protein
MAAKKKATAKARKAPARTSAPKRDAVPAKAKSAAKPATSAAKPAVSAAKPAAKKVARKAVAAKPAAAPAAAAPANPNAAAEALVKKILKYTAQDSVHEHLSELYTEDCVAVEPTGDTAIGYEGLTTKFEQWRSMQEHSSFEARNVWIKGNVIAIEWEGEIKLRDGRNISFQEVAVHELRGGRIASERFYYNPAIMGSAPQPRVEAPLAPVQPPRGTPPVDPLDL